MYVWTWALMSFLHQGPLRFVRPLFEGHVRGQMAASASRLHFLGVSAWRQAVPFWARFGAVPSCVGCLARDVSFPAKCKGIAGRAKMSPRCLQSRKSEGRGEMRGTGVSADTRESSTQGCSVPPAGGGRPARPTPRPCGGGGPSRICRTRSGAFSKYRPRS